MNYEVTYLTVNGQYSLPSHTLKEAQHDAARLKRLNKLPGHLANGITIKKVS